jgi:hypothetical protein
MRLINKSGLLAGGLTTLVDQFDNVFDKSLFICLPLGTWRQVKRCWPSN